MEEEHSPFSSVMSNLEGSKSSSKHDEQPTQDDPEIKNNVDYIVHLPLPNPNGKPSQIIKIGENSEVTIIRK